MAVLVGVVEVLLAVELQPANHGQWSDARSLVCARARARARAPTLPTRERTRIPPIAPPRPHLLGRLLLGTDADGGSSLYVLDANTNTDT